MGLSYSSLLTTKNYFNYHHSQESAWWMLRHCIFQESPLQMVLCRSLPGPDVPATLASLNSPHTSHPQDFCTMLFLLQHCSCPWSSMAGFLACLQSQMRYFTFRLPLPKPYSFLLSTCHTSELSISLVACCCLVAKACPTLVTPWTVACQAPLSMGFPRWEY